MATIFPLARTVTAADVQNAGYPAPSAVVSVDAETNVLSTDDLPKVDALGLTIISFTDAVGTTPGTFKDNPQGFNALVAAYLNTDAGKQQIQNIAGTGGSGTTPGSTPTTSTEQVFIISANNVTYSKDFTMAANLDSVTFSYGNFADGSTLQNPVVHLNRASGAGGSFPNLTVNDNSASNPPYFASMNSYVYPFYVTGTKSSDGSSYTSPIINVTCQHA